MKGLSDKLRIIYQPFVLIVIGFILAYTFLHWLLFIKAGIPLKEDLVKFWLPFGLPFIPVIIWLRPRIHLLDFANNNSSFMFQFLACIAIAVPTIIAQEYVITATGKLTALENINQLNPNQKTKYYSLENYYIDKQHIAVENTASVTGKHNENFNMLIYVVMPILAGETDTLKSENKYWLGKKYSNQISNNLSDAEKDEKYKAFAEQCQKEFEETDFGKFTYLKIVGNTEDHDEYNNALKKTEQRLNNNIVFESSTEPFEARNGKKLPWIFGSLAIGLLIYFIFLLFPKFDEDGLKHFKNGIRINDTGLGEVLEFFTPRQGFYITPIIMNLNILVYVVMVLAGLGLVSFKAHDLLNWGANYKPDTTHGQWWRLLTSTFLHGGLMHLLANMYGLLFVGIFLEPLLSKAKYVAVYLITGALASAASIWWYDATVSVGASGAIFGLYGFVLACIIAKVFPREFDKGFLTSIIVFVAFNLLMGFTGGIDNAAHIGGLVSGFVLGLMMSGKLKQQQMTKVR